MIPSFTSKLHDETTFYNAFFNDLRRCEKEVIIESPYITWTRAQTFFPVFEILMKRGVKILVVTKILDELDSNLKNQSEQVLQYFESVGVQPLLCVGGHHRKLAILDREILWEGSLNILSQYQSREIMRRIDSANLTMETFKFLNLERFI